MNVKCAYIDLAPIAGEDDADYIHRTRESSALRVTDSATTPSSLATPAVAPCVAAST